jgi:hypothetical protein
MALVSVTRLRVRAYRYLPQFAWEAMKSARQAERSAGFLGGTIFRNARNVFWTITVWRDAETMNAYRIAGAHREAMPKLLDWCDEATTAHWSQKSLELPSSREAHERMVREGKVSKVNHPSAAHASGGTAYISAPEATRIESTLKPRNPI